MIYITNINQLMQLMEFVTWIVMAMVSSCLRFDRIHFQH